MIRIGHARSPEGGGVNGAPGDQTGREVCVQGWYDSPWDYVAIHPCPKVREAHAKAVEDICVNDNCGYGQFGVGADRNSMYHEAVKVDMDFSKIKVPCNTDCSGMQNAAAVASGSGATYGNNGWTTETMERELLKLGYLISHDRKFLSNPDYAVRGSMLVRHKGGTDGHTVCVLDNGPLANETLKAAGAVCAVDKPVTTEESSAPGGTPASGGKTYTVKVGDTLGQIAVNNLGSFIAYKKIMELNGLKDTMIYPGQVLKLPERE